MELGHGFDIGMGGERPRFDDSVAQLIRSAERSISLQKFGYAREQLSLAKTLDPNNAYIPAILDRVISLERQSLNPVDTDSQRYLSVSVGPEFASGFKETEPDSPKDLQGRVRQLTNVAERFLEQGSYENAFEALMKAYLLDPVSPYVVTCEKAVLPVWQRQHQPMSASPGFASIPLRSERRSTMAQPPEYTPTPLPRASLAGPNNTQTEHDRIEALMLQKEMERQERERALWRQASSPPKASHQQSNATDESAAKAGEQKIERGLFAKLKLGKFLNP